MSTARRETRDRTEDEIRKAQASVSELDAEIEGVTGSLTEALSAPTVDDEKVDALESRRDELEHDRTRLVARIAALEGKLPSARVAADEERLAEAIASYPDGVTAVNASVELWRGKASIVEALATVAAEIVERRKALRAIRDEIHYLAAVLDVPPPELPDADHITNETFRTLGERLQLARRTELDPYFTTGFEEKLHKLHSERKDERARKRREAASEGAVS